MAHTFGQYNPTDNGCTCIGAPLSVRFIRDTEEALNNAKRYAMRDKVLSHISPAGTQSPDGHADETVVQVFAPRIVPRGSPLLRFTLGHWVASGAGQTTWRVYSMPRQFKGDDNFVASSSMLPAGSTNATIFSTSSSHSISTNTVAIARGYNDETWLMVTAENNSDSSYSKYYTLDAWPARSDDGGTISVETGSTYNRLYLNNETAAVEPTASGTWAIGPALYGELNPSKTGDPLSECWINCSGMDDYACIAAFVSAPLTANVTISGTVKAQLRAACYSGGGYFVDDPYDALEIYVVSGDGSTVRGTLVAKGTYKTTDIAWYWGYMTNKTFADGDAVSSVDALSGDRVVVKVGAYIHAGGSGGGGSGTGDTPTGDACVGVDVGDPSDTDLPENETETSRIVPWVEFSTALPL